MATPQYAVETKQELIDTINKRVEDKILEPNTANLLIKLINNASDLQEAISISALGTTYKRTGFNFDVRLDNKGDTIKYFKKNEKLSFKQDDGKPLNKLIIGDNFDALQNLLIEYRGKIDVIYIDPPYGSDSMGEFAQTNYNNNITRDNLLSMLHSRLILAKQLLSDEGVIFCSIDDKNQAYVKCLMDDIFGETNFVANFVWQKNFAPKNDNKYISISTEYILHYAKQIENYERGLLPRTEKHNKGYSNPDNDKRGLWTSGSMLATTFSQSGVFEITSPNGTKHNPPTGRCWRFSQDKIKELEKDNRIWYGSDGNGVPRIKRFLNEMPDGIVPQNLLLWEDVGSNQDGTQELKSIFNAQIFNYPKGINLINRLVSIGSIKKDALILDFFAGSATTGQAILSLNNIDDGTRSFILCNNNEITPTTPNGVAYDVTSKRLKRVMTGECYDGTKDFDWIKNNEALGGSLDVYEITPISNKDLTKDKTPFDLIDETLYGKEKFENPVDKVKWVCENFELTENELETDEAYMKRQMRGGV